MYNKVQKISPVKERILQFADSLGVSKRDFYKTIQVSRGTLEAKTGITEDIVAKFIAAYPQVDIDWLITGVGTMFGNKEPGYATEVASASDVQLAYKPKPFVDSFFGNLGKANGFALAVRADECEYLSIPFVSDYDFSIRGRGDSMINRKNPERSIYDGDLIACRLWHSRSHIRWGQVYALSTEEGVVVKQVEESSREGYVRCLSFNVEDGYKPYEIPLSEIYDWAVVVAVLHTSRW